MRLAKLFVALILFQFSILGCSQEDIEAGEIQESIERPVLGDDREEEVQSPTTCMRNLYFDQLQSPWFQRNCASATQSQLAQVNAGNLKKEKFLTQCYQATNNSCWCDQLVRPNPDSINTFYCTYGQDQVHQLIHPDEDTWDYAFEAVKIVEEFEDDNIETEIIYNWWRPEPYNGNVGGSASRHPLGTSVDVRFKTKDMQEEAFLRLCRMRAQGRVRAIGYYGSTALHFGVGDRIANTWGKVCP